MYFPMTEVYHWGLRLDSGLQEEQEEGIDYGLIPMEQKRHPPHLHRCERLIPSSVQVIESRNHNVKNHIPTETTPNYHYPDYANFRICFTSILSMATKKATETTFKNAFRGMRSWRCM